MSRPAGSDPPGDEHGEQGQAIILFALLIVALLGFTGLVVDLGQVAMRYREAQNAADAAAQGAAYEIYAGTTESGATTMADTLMTQHGYTAANLTTLQFLDSSQNPTTSSSSVYYVHSQVSQTFPTLLMGLLGVKSVSTSASATVKIGPGTPACVFCVMGATGTTLKLNGSAAIKVRNGGVVVDSDNSTAAARLDGSTTVTADTIGIVGGYQSSGGSVFSAAGAPPTTGIQPVPDPLSKITDPLSAGLCGTNQGTITVTGGGSKTISPGTYGSITVNSNANLTLLAGTYCITGTFSAAGGSTILGQGVTLYFTCGTSGAPIACTTGQVGGGFNLSGNNSYTITPPTSGDYAGLSIFYDRNDTALYTLSGNSTDIFSGTIYAKSAAATLNGNTSGSFNVGSMIVVGSATLNGLGTINLTYDQSQNVQLPHLPVFTQ